MVVEQTALLVSSMTIRGWIHQENANGMNGFVFIEPGIGSLVVPVNGHAVSVTSERIQAFPWILTARIGRGYGTFRYGAVGIAASFIEARTADEAKWRAFGQILGFRAIVGQGGEVGGFLYSIDPFIWNHGSRPGLVVLVIILD